MLFKTALAALAMLAGFHAEAQPVTNLITGQPYTLPAQLGSTGSPFKAGYTTTGRWIAWVYTRDGHERIYTRCWLYNYTLVEPETAHLKSPIAVARAYIGANTTTNCSVDPAMRPMYLAAREAFGLK